MRCYLVDQLLEVLRFDVNHIIYPGTTHQFQIIVESVIQSAIIVRKIREKLS